MVDGGWWMVDGDREEEDEEEGDGFVVFNIRDKKKKFRSFFFLFLKNNKIIDVGSLGTYVGVVLSVIIGNLPIGSFSSRPNLPIQVPQDPFFPLYHMPKPNQQNKRVRVRYKSAYIHIPTLPTYLPSFLPACLPACLHPSLTRA